jgi:exodeoxyribonuclease VII small subunit
MPKSPKKVSFEKQLTELEDIVARLEDGSLPLEESLQLFEKGIKLSRELQSALQAASMKVTYLLEGERIEEQPLPESDRKDRTEERGGRDS